MPEEGDGGGRWKGNNDRGGKLVSHRQEGSWDLRRLETKKKKKTRTRTSELIAVPAAKCGRIFVEREAKRLCDYDAIRN